MFQTRFAHLIKTGVKRQTIRPIPKRKQDIPKKGQEESWRMWTGRPYHSKQEELAQVKIVKVNRVCIRKGSYMMSGITWKASRYPSMANQFARNDGFDNWTALREWFERNHTLPFNGILIQADYFRKPLTSSVR